MAGGFLSDGAPKTADEMEELEFSKEKIGKLEETIRLMTEKERASREEMDRIKLESETISTEYFKLCEQN